MPLAAVSADASLLSPNWALASSRCTKSEMRGAPDVIDLSKVVLPDGSTMGILYLLEATERMALIMESWGNPSGVLAFAAMAHAATAADTVTSTAAFKAAAGPCFMLLWGLEALRRKRHEKSRKVFLPGPPTPVASAAANAEQQPTTAPAAA